ncbi:MAG: plasmid replication protein, CyRepA1 family, partial [Cyanobacteria bacterium J06648_11]
AAALRSLGYAAIAIPGIRAAYRTIEYENGKRDRQLIPELAPFATEGRKVYLCYDRDEKRGTRREVDRAKLATAKLFQAKGCVVFDIELPGSEKGIDDFIAARGADAFKTLYEAAKSFYLWDLKRRSALYYRIPDRRNERYLSALNLPDSTQLVAIKSAKGTGKTEAIARLVEAAIANGQPVLLLSHRIQLAQAISDRVGIPYVTELRQSETGRLVGFGLCVDSLHPRSQARFSADGWEDALMVVDECEQVFGHALSSSTCKRDRVAILRELRALFAGVLGSEDGRIVLADADLSDISIDFVAGMAGAAIQPHIVQNDWKPETGYTVRHYRQTTPTEWQADLEAAIASGQRLLVCLSAQKARSKVSTHTLERRLKNRFPTAKILRIDSETVAEPNHPAFGAIAHLDTLLAQYDVVVTSPAIETGVSIDLRGHFDSVWGCFQGV